MAGLLAFSLEATFSVNISEETVDEKLCRVIEFSRLLEWVMFVGARRELVFSGSVLKGANCVATPRKELKETPVVFLGSGTKDESLFRWFPCVEFQPDFNRVSNVMFSSFT